MIWPRAADQHAPTLDRYEDVRKLKGLAARHVLKSDHALPLPKTGDVIDPAF